jgi:hypothetical protein
MQKQQSNPFGNCFPLQREIIETGYIRPIKLENWQNWARMTISS